MPTNVEQAIVRFNESAVQAVNGCGTPNSYTMNLNRNRILLTHTDGCRLDVPFETVPHMSPEQYATIFGGLRFSEADAVTMSEMRSDALPDLAADSPLPEVTIDRDLYTAATGANRMQTVSRMARNSNAVTTLTTEQLNRRVTKRQRGTAFIERIARLGVTIPAALALPIGDVLHSMFTPIESKVAETERRLAEVREEHNTYIRNTERSLESTRESIQKMEDDQRKTQLLREAAIAWRDSTATDPDDKFRLFTALMDSIDATVPAPAAPVTPDLEATAVPSPETVARWAAEDAARPEFADADQEANRRW